MLKIEPSIKSATKLTETLLDSNIAATKEVVTFYSRIFKGVPTDHHHITNSFKKIGRKNYEAIKNFLNRR